MALRTIVEKGDPLLNKKSREVTEISPRILQLLDDMTETMRQANGVGIAAPQVGVLRRIAVVELDGTLYELINPVIVETEGDQYGEEGCLSLPGLVGSVHRPAYVKVEATDRDGNRQVYEGTDLLARAFCHEIDHLDGILYDEKADDLHYPEAEESEEEEE